MIGSRLGEWLLREWQMRGGCRLQSEVLQTSVERFETAVSANAGRKYISV
jgi:hypothetical protein